jgi:hypothetical protein
MQTTRRRTNPFDLAVAVIAGGLAVAYPAYQDYSFHAKVSALDAAVANAKARQPPARQWESSPREFHGTPPRLPRTAATPGEPHGTSRGRTDSAD